MRTAHVESSHSSAPMADHCPVLELLAQLTATPVRRGGILDIPFDEYVEPSPGPRSASSPIPLRDGVSVAGAP